MRRALALVLLLLTGACSRPGAPSAAGDPGAATVVRPIDGDTVLLRLEAGGEERIRLIGIDTPESVSRQRPVECFGPEAKHRTAELLPAGTRVRVERDVEARDVYDRLLAYVVRADDGILVNLLLVSEGYAESARYAPNLAHQPELDRAEAEAKAAGRGLWPACGGTDVVRGP